MCDVNEKNTVASSPDVVLTPEMFERLPDSEKNSEFIAMVADRIRLQTK